MFLLKDYGIRALQQFLFFVLTDLRFGKCIMQEKTASHQVVHVSVAMVD